MRPIRQSDIEIAKAEVAILRSLGMEPDADALRLSGLEVAPPAPAEDSQQGGSSSGRHAADLEDASLPGGPLSYAEAATLSDDTLGADDEISLAMVIPIPESDDVMFVPFGKSRPASGKSGARKVISGQRIVRKSDFMGGGTKLTREQRAQILKRRMQESLRHLHAKSTTGTAGTPRRQGVESSGGPEELGRSESE